MATIPTAATRISFAPAELNAQASANPLVRFENGSSFHVQADGNLCYYTPAKCTWHSASNVGSGDASKLVLRFQDDGNLVLYHEGKPRWESKTPGVGKKLVVQDAMPYLMVLDEQGDVAWYSKQGKE
ncbi:hypothetical protein MMC30_006613 [Trapelia coarctata]|nr:hypothetical protein [Trapelia coarctata]